MPCRFNESSRPCSSTSCVLQYGHQSADRKNTSIRPREPSNDVSVRERPCWSVKVKSGTRAPTCGPSFWISGSAGAADCGCARSVRQDAITATMTADGVHTERRRRVTGDLLFQAYVIERESRKS